MISKPNLTISTEVVPQANAAWHSLTSDMARAGLQESEQWSFLSGLVVLAWQAALCATPSFPSYSAWFQTSFLGKPSRSRQLLVSQNTMIYSGENGGKEYIGEEEYKKDNLQYQAMPYGHRKKIAKFYCATPELVHKGITTAVAAKADSESISIVEKIQMYLKVSNQMAVIYRADLNTTAKLGQAKTMVKVSKNNLD